MGDGRQAFTSTARPASAPCAPPSSTPSACAASAGFTRIFATAVLEDDDEVAVLHGPEELGYPPLTEAMVNIRATLRGRERKPA